MARRCTQSDAYLMIVEAIARVRARKRREALYLKFQPDSRETDA